MTTEQKPREATEYEAEPTECQCGDHPDPPKYDKRAKSTHKKNARKMKKGRK